MKKLLLVLSFLLISSPAFGWNLFFIDQLEDIGEGEMGFVLGAYKVSQSSVVIVKTVGVTSMFIYVTKDNGLAAEAYGLPEFRGFGYIDMVTRIAEGLSNAGTWNEIKYITGAHWFTGGEWYFGNIYEWETAGSPEPVWFGKYRDILGTDIE